MTISPVEPSAVETPTASFELTAVESQRLVSLLRTSRSINTNRAYAAQLRRFQGWMKERGFKVALPAPPTVVALYLAHLNDEGSKVSTLTQAVAALEALHTDMGQKANFTSKNIVRAALNSARREMANDGRSQLDKAPALSKDEVQRFLTALSGSEGPTDIRNRALLTLGFNSALRAQNLLSIQREHLTFDETGLTIKVPQSKTDQFGRGNVLYVERLSPTAKVFDAVRILEEWLMIRDELFQSEGFNTSTGPIFPALRKGGSLHLADGYPHGMSTTALAYMMTAIAQDAGIRDDLSPHSMRHTFITLALDSGADNLTITRTTLHASVDSLRNYDQRQVKSSALSRKIFD